MEYTETELKAMKKNPFVMRALADYHDEQESCADVMGVIDSAKYHRDRRLELEAEADRILAEWGC